MTITSIQHKGGSTFSEIKASFADAKGHQHISYSSWQGLHIDPRLEKSSPFLKRFRSRQELEDRATIREVTIEKIKKSIDDEFGPGMAERAFARANQAEELGLTKDGVDGLDSGSKKILKKAIDKEYGQGAGERVFKHAGDGKGSVDLTKNYLDSVGNAIKELQAEAELPANRRLGVTDNPVTIEQLLDTAVAGGLLSPAREITDADKNALRARMREAVLAQPDDAKPLQCLRAAQLALLEDDLERELNERYKNQPETVAKPQREKLAAYLTNLEAPNGPWRRIPLEKAGYVLRQSCMTGELTAECEAQLSGLSREWPAPEVPAGNGDDPAGGQPAPGLQQNEGQALPPAGNRPHAPEGLRDRSRTTGADTDSLVRRHTMQNAQRKPRILSTGEQRHAQWVTPSSAPSVHRHRDAVASSESVHKAQRAAALRTLGLADRDEAYSNQEIMKKYEEESRPMVGLFGATPERMLARQRELEKARDVLLADPPAAD